MHTKPQKAIYLQLGMKCNNKCLHCTFLNELNKPGENVTFENVLEWMKRVKLKDYELLMLTGGEPTVYPFLGKLILYIVRTYPNMNVILLTNGRRLHKFKDDFRKIYDRTNKLQVVIPMHSDSEKEFNRIVDSSSGNPYLETLNSIREFRKEFKTLFRWRSITVLNKINIKTIDTLYALIAELGATEIAMSYPVLENGDDKYLRSISFDYSMLTTPLSKIGKVMEIYSDIQYWFSEIPMCVFGDLENIDPNSINLTTEISLTQYDEGRTVKQDTKIKETVNYKYPTCEECIYDANCTGIRYKAGELYENKILQPVLRRK